MRGNGEVKHCWWREQQGQMLSQEGWVVCVFGDPGIPLIQKRAGLCKPQEGGAWAGFVLT